MPRGTRGGGAPTIQHASTGSGGFEVTEVAVVDPSGTQHTEANGVGVLGAGDTAEVPLARFATAGGHAAHSPRSRETVRRRRRGGQKRPPHTSGVRERLRANRVDGDDDGRTEQSTDGDGSTAVLRSSAPSR
ncbi:hypothetical protein C2R22_14110 [Salinigranum rubrum]|uniref:Uncharacterized protein n=1 Tax=Salinigranum rubrum TaxID=755307 RepID=A0A2I8VL24_9EURY|nr:hypothetical protein C2R22_14110 [Salinigranum rubrum]